MATPMIANLRTSFSTTTWASVKRDQPSSGRGVGKRVAHGLLGSLSSLPRVTLRSRSTTDTMAVPPPRSYW